MQENSTQRETKIIELPLSKAKIEMFTYMIAREWFNLQKAAAGAGENEFPIKTFILKFNEETDKEKIYESISNLRLTDWKIINKELGTLLDDIMDKKK